MRFLTKVGRIVVQPGVFGFNPLNLKMSDANRLKEIKNGRLAMCGVGGVIHSMFIYKVSSDILPYISHAMTD